MSVDLRTVVAGLELKNPVIAASSEATASETQIRACLDAGAAAVVAKSLNESPAAHANLRAAEYVLLDEQLQPRPLGPAKPGDSLYCRSGLLGGDLDEWARTLAVLDREAAAADAYVVPSLIVSDAEWATRAAAAFERAGLRWLELNIGAPHAQEASGAIRSGVQLVSIVRAAVGLPLSVKLAAGDSPAAVLEAGADAVCIATRTMGFLPDPATRRPTLGTFAAVGGRWALPATLYAVAKTHLAQPHASIIATNGVRHGLDVVRTLLAGADAAALATAVITDGPEALARIIAELGCYCEKHALGVRDLVGEAAHHVQTYEEVALESRH